MTRTWQQLPGCRVPFFGSCSGKKLKLCHIFRADMSLQRCPGTQSSFDISLHSSLPSWTSASEMFTIAY